MATGIQNMANFSRKQFEEVSFSVLLKKKYVDKSSILEIIRRMQIQTTKRYHHPTLKMSSVKSLQTINAEGFFYRTVYPEVAGEM